MKQLLQNLKNGATEEEMGNTLDKDKFFRYLKVFGVKKMEKWAGRFWDFCGTISTRRASFWATGAAIF